MSKEAGDGTRDPVATEENAAVIGSEPAVKKRTIMVSSYVDVDLTIRMNMGSYGNEWDMADMYEQILKEAERRVVTVFHPGKIAGYTIKSIKAHTVYTEKESKF